MTGLTCAEHIYIPHMKPYFNEWDCPNYVYNWDKTHITHSTCAIIHKGKCYYINPHGDVEGEYYQTWNNWNEKEQLVYKYKFDPTFDKTLICCLMEEMNIKYDYSSSNTYNGICFIS